jgi:hypothetical protein
MKDLELLIKIYCSPTKQYTTNVNEGPLDYVKPLIKKRLLKEEPINGAREGRLEKYQYKYTLTEKGISEVKAALIYATDKLLLSIGFSNPLDLSER